MNKEIQNQTKQNVAYYSRVSSSKLRGEILSGIDK